MAVTSENYLNKNYKRFRFQLRRFWSETKHKQTISSLIKREIRSTEKLWFKTIGYEQFCWSYQQSFLSKSITYCSTQIEGGFCHMTFFDKLLNLKTCLAYNMSLICLKIWVTSRKTYATFLTKILKPLKYLQWAKVKRNIGLNIPNG